MFTCSVRKIRRYLLIMGKFWRHFLIWVKVRQGRDEMTFRFDFCIRTLFQDYYYFAIQTWNMPHMDITNYNLGEPPSVCMRTKRKMCRRTKRKLCRDTKRTISSSDQVQNTKRTISSSDQSLSLGMKSKRITKRGKRIYKKVSIK